MFKALVVAFTILFGAVGAQAQQNNSQEEQPTVVDNQIVCFSSSYLSNTLARLGNIVLAYWVEEGNNGYKYVGALLVNPKTLDVFVIAVLDETSCVVAIGGGFHIDEDVYMALATKQVYGVEPKTKSGQ